jgi:hypothetical protein
MERSLRERDLDAGRGQPPLHLCRHFSADTLPLFELACPESQLELQGRVPETEKHGQGLGSRQSILVRASRREKDFTDLFRI